MNIKNLSKRVISLLLVLTLMLSLVTLTGCGDEESSSEFENPLETPNLDSSTGLPVEQPESPDASMTQEDLKEIAETKMNFGQAISTNSDTVGWVKIPGTNIDYPVLQENPNGGYMNQYYLNRDINKQTSKNGVIFADFRTVFGTKNTMSKNTVLYGHNWTNISANPRIGNEEDVMFAQLTGYHHLDFAKEHPYIYFNSLHKDMVWVVFAAFYTHINFNYIDPNPTDAEFKNIINGAKERSEHIFDVDVNTSDKILTLSTCTRRFKNLGDKQRFVVMARLLRADETTDDKISVKTNPNPKLPA